MKKLVAIFVALVIAMGALLTYTIVIAVNEFENMVMEDNQKEESVKDVWDNDVYTAYFMVQSETSDGFLDAKPVGFKMDGGMILDNEYELGDIVLVTWNKDGDIMFDRIATETEKNYLDKHYFAEINSLMEEGIEIAGSWN